MRDYGLSFFMPDSRETVKNKNDTRLKNMYSQHVKSDTIFLNPGYEWHSRRFTFEDNSITIKLWLGSKRQNLQ